MPEYTPSRIQGESPRDVSIDTIKGIGCLMMVLVHSFSDHRGIPLLRLFMELGDIAPALFLAVTGILAARQAKKKSIRAIITFYLLFFLFGMSFSFLLGRGPARILNSDILQMHSVAVILIVLIVRRYVLTPRRAVSLAIGCFLLNFLLWPVAPSLPGLQYIIWIPGGKAVYPIFPWMAAPLLGIAADKLRPRENIALGLVSIFVVLCLAMVKVWMWDVRFLYKANMSLPYFAMVCTAIFLATGLCRAAKILDRLPLVAYFGINSLLFFYVHYALVFVLREIGIPHTPVFWGILIICTYVVMRATTCLNAAIGSPFEKWQSWCILLIVIISTPFVFQEWRIVVLVEALSGSLFALNYGQLKRLVENRSKDEVQAPLGVLTDGGVA